MAYITENLQIIMDNRLAIKQAIIDKGGNVGDLTTYANAIRNLPAGDSDGGSSGGSSSGKGDVTLYDYDGTVLHSFSKDEFLALNELPSLPTQPGLTCQGWNYDITNAKTYVEEYGKLDIGATYITDDGKTRLYIKIAAEGRMTVPLYFSQTVANGVTIDWGDGSATQTLSGTGNINTSHTYANIGDYCIALTVLSGCTLELGHDSSSYCVMGSTDNNGRVYCNMLQKVEIGTGVTNIRQYSFYSCYSLASVVIPNSVTSIGGDYSFYSCYSLASVVIPNSVTSIGSNAFYNCCNLASVVIPNSVTSIGSQAFIYCYSLATVVIPNSVTSIGTYAFNSCYSLASVVIPNSVTSIGSNAFYSCYSLASVVIPNSVTSIGSNSFNGCYSLASVVIPNSVKSIGGNAFYSCYPLASVVIPNSVTSIGSQAFYSCYSLASVVIPNSVKSIGTYAFYNCRSLASVVIPNSVTSIGNYTFNGCYGMAFYDFSNHTGVPTLANTNAFSGIPSDCKIIVPDGLYDAWIAATNWSTYATKIIKKSDWDAL